MQVSPMQYFHFVERTRYFEVASKIYNINHTILGLQNHLKYQYSDYQNIFNENYSKTTIFEMNS